MTQTVTTALSPRPQPSQAARSFRFAASIILQQFLQNFGCLALFLGTFFEGGTVFMLAGFLAFHGYMQLDTVILIAFLGSYAGDQLWYFLGCCHGRRLLAREPCWQRLGDKALDRMHHRPDLWILNFHFVYGLRAVMPVTIGLSGYPPTRYLLLDGIGATVWAVTPGFATYYFGSVLEGMLGSIKKYKLMILGGLIVLGLLPRLWRRFKTPRGNGTGGNADKSE